MDGQRIQLETWTSGSSLRVGQSVLALESADPSAQPAGETSGPRAAPSTVLDADSRGSQRAASDRPLFKLVVVAGADRGRSHPLARGRTVLGREGDIVVADARVSRKHAEIEVLGSSQVMVKDLASGNGTLVNDQRISSSTLRPGDVLKLGDTELRFEPHG
jgi:pSer/pThr/pTyr-binding forkhead associated (FHA) protein